MTDDTAIVCEIHSAADQSADLEYIVLFCARQAGLRLAVIAGETPSATPVVTLQLNSEQAAADRSVWCLVCRLACFCPQARVGAVVQAPSAFVPTRAGAERTA